MKRIKLFLFLLVFSSVSHALTLSQIQTEIRVRAKDTYVGRQRYSDAQLTNLINEAQRDVINKTWATENTTSYVTTVGTTYYAFPTDIITVERVTQNKKNLTEETLIKRDGDSGNSNWEELTGPPQSYFIDLARPSEFGIYPFPANVSSTVTITMHYYCKASDLSSASDVPFNSDRNIQQYADLLIFYPVYRIYLVEGEIDKATLYRQEYESRLQNMEEASGRRPNYNASFSGAAHGR